MKIQGAHLQMTSNQCTNFQKNLCTHFLEHEWTVSCPQTGVKQTDGQKDRWTEGWMDRHTDRVIPIYPLNFVHKGIIKMVSINSQRKFDFRKMTINGKEMENVEKNG